MFFKQFATTINDVFGAEQSLFRSYKFSDLLSVLRQSLLPQKMYFPKFLLFFQIYEEAPPPNSLSTEFESLENPPSLTEPIGTSNTLSRITGRRQKLPAVKADTAGLNLWNLLCKNIGKDLSKISMPVTLNEPLSVLQRLCEELEYSELLDKAAGLSDPVERMTYVAAFAVSAYGYCTARAGHKPFNPLLGEF